MADHTHDMVFDNETPEQAVFKCKKCKRSVGVWKPDTGRHPQAVEAGKGKFALPSDDGFIGNTLGNICDNSGR